MRIGELARRTGVPAPTIKYYTREGLLPPGERTGPNQVRYGEPHIRRLGLIRALLDVGGLSVAAAREVLHEVDTPGRTVHGMLGAAQSALGPAPGRAAVEPVEEDGEPAGDTERAEREVDGLVRRHGWTVKQENPGRRALVRIVAAYRDLDQHELLGLLDRYAEAAGELAAAELEMVSRAPGADAKVESAVLSTVLGDAALAALRRIAQEDASG